MTVYNNNNINPASIVGQILYYFFFIYSYFFLRRNHHRRDGVVVGMDKRWIGRHNIIYFLYFFLCAKSFLKVGTWTLLVITYKPSNQFTCEFLCSHLHNNISDRLIPSYDFICSAVCTVEIVDGLTIMITVFQWYNSVSCYLR